MSTARTLAKNTTVLLISQIISYILAFLYTIYTANYLGVAGFGVLTVAIALGGIFSIITDFGLSVIIVREVARDKSLAKQYIWNATALKIILGVITVIAAVVFVTIKGYPAQTAGVIYLITLSFVIGGISGIFSSIFQAHEKMEYQSIALIINSILMFAGILIIIQYKLDIVILALFYLIISLLLLFFSVIICAWKFSLPKIEVDLSFWKPLIMDAYPLALTSLFAFIAFRVDTILLFMISGDYATGLYGASYRLMEALMFIPSVYATSILPIFSRFHVSSKDRMKIYYVKSLKYLGILGLPIAVGTTLLANKIILFIYKGDYAQSAVVLQILIWAIPIIFLAYILGASITSINKQHETVRVTLIAMILNIALNIILIPKYSYIAASVITVLTELTVFLLYFYIISKYLCKVSLISILGKPIIASIFMSLVIIFINNLFLAIIIGTIVYFGVLVLLKTFTQEDIDLFRQIVKRN
ncbi:MAG: flippase [Methanobacterium sp.]|uniref:flippase n=1 Tax=Methanobacterium sp. TaxID=2164 RepID=UPI003D650689|nr:flippase [Methanobacterium sp.]